MCGRYAFDDIKEIYEARKILADLSQRLGEKAAAGVKTGEIFPTDKAAVIAQNAQGYGADIMAWGYPLARTKKIIINARSETLAQKPFFAKSLAAKKCLIPCTGFFEWKSVGKGKQKYLIRPQSEDFFYLAGLYNAFNNSEESVQNRFVIITAPANKFMKDIHGRMPLIVKTGDVEKWFEKNIDFNKLSDQIYDKIRELSAQAV